MFTKKTAWIIFFLSLSVCSFAQPDSTGNRQRKWQIIPMISNSPELGLLLGVNPVKTFKINRADSVLRPSFLSPQLFGTFKRQFGIEIPGNLFFSQNKYVLDFRLSATSSRWRYYGIGNEVDLDQYDTYRFKALAADVILLRKVVAHMYLGGGYRYNYQDISTPPNGGLLDTDRPTGYRGFTASGAAAVIRWDSRDNILNTYKGSFLNLRGEIHRPGLGSSHAFEALTVDFRHFIPLSDQPFHVLAFQVLHQATFGEVPFAELGMLGGSVINRGYFSGAFRDRHLISAQAEYREMLGRNLGGVIFASAGKLMTTYHELDPEEARFSWGVGLRYALIPESRLNLRLDLAWGEDSQGLYFGISEAF